MIKKCAASRCRAAAEVAGLCRTHYKRQEAIDRERSAAEKKAEERRAVLVDICDLPRSGGERRTRDGNCTCAVCGAGLRKNSGR